MPDPSDAPPHEWLEGDPYGTAGSEAPPLPKVMGLVSCTCVPAPAITVERSRWAALGFGWSGDCGDLNHRYGGHIPACRLPASDYTMKGALNRPADNRHAVSGDFRCDNPRAREYLKRLITAIREDRITGVMEIIGSVDGKTARYWSDAGTWSDAGERYLGSGHIDWFHLTVYRSTSTIDHKIISTLTEAPMAETFEGRSKLKRDVPTAVGDVWEGFMNGQTLWGDGNSAWMLREIRALRADVATIKESLGKVQAGVVDVPALAESLRDELGEKLANELAERLKA